MKSNKIKIAVAVLMICTVIFAVMHISSREDIPEQVLQVKAGENTYMLDITKLEYEAVSGIRVNGKGEEVPIEGQGILVKDVLESHFFMEFQKIIIIADDSYQVEVTAEEIMQDGKVYFLQEEGGLRLVVFGDENSKRSVSNVVQIIVEP